MTNQKEKRKVPELRFPEFSGEWEENYLGNVLLPIKGGGTPSKSNDNYYIGDIPWMTVKDIKNNKYIYETENHITEEAIQNSATNLVEIDSLIIPTRMAVGKILINKKEVTINQDLKFTKPKSLFDIEFIYYHYTKLSKEISNLGSGSTVSGIDLNTLKTIKMNFPSLHEQQKIGDFFSKLDRQIELEEKKLALLEEQKKGYMQKIFSQELRFKDENGEEYPEWEEDYLKNLFNIKSSGDIDQSSLSTIYQNEYVYPVYGNALSNDGLLGYYSTYMFDEDALTVTGRGEVGIPIYRDKKFNAVGRLLVLNNKLHIYSLFYLYVLRNTHFYNETTGVPQLTAPTLGQYKVSKPIYNEQQKIGLFLKKIDEKKYLIEKKIKHLLTRKSCLLGKIII